MESAKTSLAGIGSPHETQNIYVEHVFVKFTVLKIDETFLNEKAIF